MRYVIPIDKVEPLLNLPSIFDLRNAAQERIWPILSPNSAYLILINKLEPRINLAHLLTIIEFSPPLKWVLNSRLLSRSSTQFHIIPMYEIGLRVNLAHVFYIKKFGPSQFASLNPHLKNLIQ